MAIQLTCEGCGKRVRVPDHAAGRKGRCPVCGREIHIPDVAQDAPPAAEPIAAASAEPLVRSAGDGPGREAPGRREANALGIASLVLGILALLIAWIPLLGLLAWPLGGIGILLGLIGLVLAVRNRRWGTTSPIAGLATNGAAVVVAVIATLWAGRALQDAARNGQFGMIPAAGQSGMPGPPPDLMKGLAPPEPPKPDGTFAGQDRNGDGRLNADEVPADLKARFAEIDADGDGYVERTEWDRATAVAAPDAPQGGGKVIARRVFTAADDFVVDVWHNGRRVPDDKRAMVGENYGATSEKIEIEVREGDWLVFNVANNRLRWDGASYFGAAGVNDEEPKIAFVTDPADGRWSYCDDLGRVPAFIAHRDYLADQAALAPSNPWGGGDGEMQGRVPGWPGRPIWGRERTTWLKFVARPGPGPAATPRAAAKPEPGAEEGQPSRLEPASTGGAPDAATAF